MSEAGRPIAEEELHAYVDERLDPARRAAVARYLQENPAAAERVRAYCVQREGLRAAFAAVAAEPIPPALNLTRLIEARLARRRTSWLPRGQIAAAIALAFAVGGAGGWFVHSGLPGREAGGIAALEAEAAASHVVYAADRRRPIELGATHRGDLAQWLSNRLNHPVAPPDLAAIGYRFMGGRLVATDHGAAALFMYDNDHGARLTLFLRPMQPARSTPILALDVGDVDGCAWIDKGVGYALIAAAPYQELVRMSEFVRKQIDDRV